MNYTMLRWRPWIGLLGLMLSFGSISQAVDVTIGWDSENGVAGYIIYCGSASGDYTNEIDAETDTTVTLADLAAGQTYYFAIASYDTDGNQSALSPEISYLVPGIVVLTQGTNPDDPLILSFPESPGDWYEVQSSPDLINWTTFWETDPAYYNDWVQIWIIGYQETVQQFFRLIMH